LPGLINPLSIRGPAVNSPVPMNVPDSLSRREFLVGSAAALVAARCTFGATGPTAEPIIDIHQHTNYGGRRDAAFRQIFPARTHDELLAHQRGMGATKT